MLTPLKTLTRRLRDKYVRGEPITIENSVIDTIINIVIFYDIIRCISGDQLRMDGSTVNDSHAEVIARRSLIKFFHYHLTILLSGKTEVKSIFVQKERQGKIQLRDGVKFHLYVSTAPCGDAAIFVNETVSR